MQLKKLLEEAREGYYFFQSKRTNHRQALDQVNVVYKFTYLPYFASSLTLLIAFTRLFWYLVTEQTLYWEVKKNLVYSAVVGGILMYSHKLLAEKLMGDVLYKEIEVEQEEAAIKRKIRLCHFLFLGGIVCLALSMLLMWLFQLITG